MNKVIKIGTRGSALAMWQAGHVRDQLQSNWPEMDFDLVVIKTSGDWVPSEGEVRLAQQAGGKAQFAKEIEEALLNGQIDMAVHSMKDMDSVLPQGLVIPCMLPREDARDAVLLRDRDAVGKWVDQLVGSTVGTVSVRRQAALAALCKDVSFTPLRGNVGTRISKLRGELAQNHPDLNATMLAVAGLKRLGLEHEIDHVVCPHDMLPAAAQGAIGVEILANNSQLLKLLNPLNCVKTQQAVEAERAVLAALGGSCHTPIGVYGEFDGDELWLRASLYSLDGADIFKDEARGVIRSLPDAINLGREMGARMKASVPSEILEQCIP